MQWSIFFSLLKVFRNIRKAVVIACISCNGIQHTISVLAHDCSTNVYTIIKKKYVGNRELLQKTEFPSRSSSVSRVKFYESIYVNRPVCGACQIMMRENFTQLRILCIFLALGKDHKIRNIFMNFSFY